MADTPYSHVRALTRGLDLLLALNRLGHATAHQLSTAVGMDRATTYRLLDTLSSDGYVRRSASSKFFRLTFKVRQLSDGFSKTDAITQIVAPELGQLLPKVLWPSDFAVFEDGAMVIRETTHPFSPFSIHRAMVGRSRPLLKTALGRAVLASATPKLRREMLKVVINTMQSDAGEAANAQFVTKLLAEYREHGYAMNMGAVEDKISAIALPIHINEEVWGAINIIFYKNALSCQQAAQQFLADLRSTVEAIEQKCRDLDLTALGNSS